MKETKLEANYTPYKGDASKRCEVCEFFIERGETLAMHGSLEVDGLISRVGSCKNFRPRFRPTEVVTNE